MFGLSFWEIALVLVVALIVLGPKRLPQLAKSVGKGLRELRRASTDLRSAIEEPLEEIRKPLDEIRGDLVDTVHDFGREIEREATGDDKTLPDTNPYAATDTDSPPEEPEEAPTDIAEGAPTEIAEPEEAPTEVEDRRQAVEALYARYAREEEGETSTAADEPSGPDPEPPARPGSGS